MNETAADISHHIWATKYRYTGSDGPECTIEDTWRRVASALSAVESQDQSLWRERFFDLLKDFKFLPGGRILAGAGTTRNVTLFNCFVMGTVEDSMPGIFSALQEGAITMQQGGGIGYDFSTLRPRGMVAKGTGAIASGPVSFMEIWDAMCGAILSTGARRGAMMATLRCDHPDIEEFVTAKRQPGRLRRFNLSVLVTDALMTAVRADDDWPLLFPMTESDAQGDTILREWSGQADPVPCRVIRRIRARALWDLILRSTYDFAEPGVLFIDRINQLDNLWYRERISATNPCGEIPLPAYGACDLGSLNLTRFVLEPFTKKARIDLEALSRAAGLVVRLLDNVIDASKFPLPAQAESARGSRRIGLGITGLADAFLMIGAIYGEKDSLARAAEVMRAVCHAAYRSSIALAEEKGKFPWFERDKYLCGPFIRSLPEDIREAIDKHGVRNSHLLAIAPTGTISLLAGNVSSGVEPIFAGSYSRQVLAEDGKSKEFALTDYALDLWRRETNVKSGAPDCFVTTAELSIRAHLDIQSALQPFVDNSISKTINAPRDSPFSEFRSLYDLAYDAGLKGCTTFRSNPVTGAVLSREGPGSDAPHCCTLEREPD
ncbi:adenosylcobalamin-dependent ribonucleoside-diphosphate reductase [Methylosinus sp. KRF6]|uniref:adenosylcobalamin-dependent ribonucleoside-diphosphate reductase n=1 Tax=Methylosinus sp. KRF6 TaxID=2846853 RepID=UPI001C0E2621|nr:adenosylcobalamin-dependent ribonucleoside-diphosphate reductase [Methylosinus sp. KRF6]MBU3889795.1 adenosylcobalamin-dependent ribonucleoside-diphosphate reductase [Methylosinus sp. KRF6]